MGRAFAHQSNCNLCEHRCGVDRAAGERGPCKAGPSANVYRHRVEYGEELELVPSHLFYLSGCDLRCVFCIAELNAFDPTRGRELTSEFFNEAVTWGRVQGVVLATLHTPDAVQTIQRIFGAFPPEQQNHILFQLSNALQAIVAQNLLPWADGKGLVLACEVCVATPAIRKFIRDGESHLIYSEIQT